MSTSSNDLKTTVTIKAQVIQQLPRSAKFGEPAICQSKLALAAILQKSDREGASILYSQTGLQQLIVARCPETTDKALEWFYPNVRTAFRRYQH